jgi:hypothetical protein
VTCAPLHIPAALSHHNTDRSVPPAVSCCTSQVVLARGVYISCCHWLDINAHTQCRGIGTHTHTHTHTHTQTSRTSSGKLAIYEGSVIFSTDPFGAAPRGNLPNAATHFRMLRALASASNATPATTWAVFFEDDAQIHADAAALCVMLAVAYRRCSVCVCVCVCVCVSLARLRLYET